MRQAKIYRYQLPMDSGVILRNTRLAHREGFVVQVKEDQSLGFGEAAPLAGFSIETLEDIQPVLIEILEQWVLTGNWPDDLMIYPPSVSFAISMAKMTLNHELKSTDICQVAPLCSGDPDALIPVLEEMQGTPIAKMKVGFYEPIRDGILVNLFLESLPDLIVRLDANQQWNLDKALKFASYIEPQYRHRIAFVEEPCQTIEDCLAFAAQSQIKIAWDEQLQLAVRNQTISELSQHIENVGAWVIKPSLVGDIQYCRTLIDQAQSLGIDAVISSSLESSLGLNQLRQISADWMPEQTPGLDTLQLFQVQLEHPWPNSNLPLWQLEEQTCVWSR